MKNFTLQNIVDYLYDNKPDADANYIETLPSVSTDADVDQIIFWLDQTKKNADQKPSRLWYAGHNEYGVQVANYGWHYMAFDTKAARDMWVDDVNDFFGKVVAEPATRSNVKSWCGEAFNIEYIGHYAGVREYKCHRS